MFHTVFEPNVSYQSSGIETHVYHSRYVDVRNLLLLLLLLLLRDKRAAARAVNWHLSAAAADVRQHGVSPRMESHIAPRNYAACV